MGQQPPDSRPRIWDGGVTERDWDRMDLAALQPYWLTGEFPVSRLPRVAQNELERGRSGDAILMLLALDPPDTRAHAFIEAYRTDVNGLVLRALHEAGVPEMTVDQAWRQVIREEAELIVNGDDLDRADSADNLSWMSWKTDLEALKDFRELDLEQAQYWDTETRGPIDLARVEAAERLLTLT